MVRKFEIDRARWQAATPYLNQALDLSPAELGVFLQELDTTQPAIAGDVRQLLSLRTGSFDSFLSDGATLAPPELQRSQQGELIGNYRILRELGSGGMATVYLAERADGHFEQHVALKILRVSANSGEARRHFTQERQILASLDHPAIARLIDGGITHAGLPYLAMEYVEGLPIDRFCDQQRLDITARLRLFLQVARAVEHAHQHLIVHRDLKPSNIVVTQAGVVKLLDFGIAKLLDPDSLVNAAPPTRDVRMLTPDYASPEQARGDVITTAVDVYQLGRLLYELLTGQSPYPQGARNALESLRVILENEPRRPSTALALIDGNAQSEERQHREALSAARATTPRRLGQVLRGDLDAILLRALHKDSQRRYASVASFAEDIERYLLRLPVNAHDGVWAYRARKFLQRHSRGVAATAFVVCAFAAMIAWYTGQLAAEVQRAQREAATARRVAGFIATVFRGGSNSGLTRPDTTARELLERGAARIEKELADQPAVQARLLNVIGRTYLQYDMMDKAQAAIERALQLNLQEFGAQSIEVAGSKYDLADLVEARGEPQRSRQLLEEVRAVQEREFGPQDSRVADTLNAQCRNYMSLRQPREAVRFCQRAAGLYAQVLSPDDERAVNADNTLGGALAQAGDYMGARAHYAQLVPRAERVFGLNHRTLANTLINFGIVNRELGEFADAERHTQRALTIIQGLYGPDHVNARMARTNLGVVYADTGRLREAVRISAQVIADSQRLKGPGHSLEATAEQTLGRALQSAGDYAAAQAHFAAAGEILQRPPGESSFGYAVNAIDAALLLLDEGQPALAVASLGAALQTLSSTLTEDDTDLAHALVAHGTLLARTGQAAKGETEIRRAIAIYQKRMPPTHRSTAAARNALGEARLAQGDLAAAEKLLLDSDRALGPLLHSVRRRSLQRLIQLYERKQDAQSVALYREQLAEFERRVRLTMQ